MDMVVVLGVLLPSLYLTVFPNAELFIIIAVPRIMC